LREEVIVDKDVNAGMQQLVQLPGLKKYMNSLKDKEREHFTRHLRRYISIYMPDCPFEVTTTNRYTITEHEASITARRDINPREEIKYLTGVQVAMTEEQEKTLELARKDFSLVISSRKKTRSLFLGPARFANHDCDANAMLSTKGYDGMQVVAVKPIAQGEEITVSYGEDYFGDDNEECLCQTCENGHVNGWAPYRREEDSDEEEEEEEEPEMKRKSRQGTSKLQVDSHSLRNKRKLGHTDEETSRDTTPKKRQKMEPKEEQISPTRSPLNHLRAKALRKAASTSNLKEKIPISSIENAPTSMARTSRTSREIRSQQRVGLLSYDDSSSRNTTPDPSSNVTGSPKSSQSTDATSVDEDHPTDKLKVDPETIHEKPALGVVTIKDEVTTLVSAPWATLFGDESSSDLSELSDNKEFDDVLQQIIKRKRLSLPLPPRNTRSTSKNENHNFVGTPVPEHCLDEGWVENTRKPGDYMTSRSRLSGKDCKWVECQTCEENFVQEDGHRGTRKECPRCERHSKLYGFAWPKTEREGKHDSEERILDHRTIHRFVDADEEKTLRKDGKGKRKFRHEILERFSTPQSSQRDSSMSTSIEADSGRKRRRVRKTM
jgi:histone-lysine N-methyltransferase SUV420H